MANFIKRVQISDKILLNFFNRKIKCKALDAYMPCITYLGSAVFSFLFCIIAIVSKKSSIHLLGLNCAASLFFSNITAQIIKRYVNRIRPYLALDDLNIKLIGIDKYSFPSGHTTAVFSIAVMISLTFPTTTLICMFLAFSTGISRMYLGVHYPSDVIVGMILGTLSSIIIYVI